ncbi:Hsp70 family protein [Nocardia sp. NBC_00508]|uniref:Hsp70 family protein n=1 Tax=Nocardia sp. NBC_00508 TaxID=2975992 RepID=UPI002E8104A0|nr:Hsp70 family protein [Nocardia sp. NBC_00508]WUD68008.1 Hsp70 family protein [Nocardia sp. NBC_00508]
MNSVTASVAAERTRPTVRSRRTAVTFDSAGGLRLGGIPQFSMAVTDFADLGRDPDAVIVGGRIWSPANLIAAVVNELRAVEPGTSEAGVVATYPAMYSDKQVSLLRQALDLSGAGDVLLVPEPVAAAEWLEHEHGPLETSFVLVYDLGGTSLDVTIVRVGPDWDNHPMIGKPVRSYDFGGRPLGSMIARYAPDVSPKSTRLSMTSLVDIDGLRTAHVQDSLELVRDCVRSAGITMSDISRILLVGGASRPAEVARTLAELGRPVMISADPGHTVAAGAALMAARTMALGASGGRAGAPRVAVFSSAAVVSAVAMSAVTVFGGPTVPELSPMLERLPDLPASADNLLYEVGGEHFAETWSRMSSPAEWNSSSVLPSLLSPRASAYTRFITPVPRSANYGPSVSESRIASHRDPRNCCTPGGLRRSGYSDPAYFTNPLPFGPVIRPAPKDTAQPPASGQPGRIVVGRPPGDGLPGRPPGSGELPAPGDVTSAPSNTGAPLPGANLPAPQGNSTTTPGPASGPAMSGSTPGTRTDIPATDASDSQNAGTVSGGRGDSSGTDSTGSPSRAGGASGGASSGASDGTSTGGASSGTDSTSGTASTSGSNGSSSSGASTGRSSGGSAGGSSSGGSAGGSSSGGSAGGSSSGGSAGGSSSGGSAGGSSSGGSAGGSSTGGSASSGRSGGTSSTGGSAGGNSSGASSSGGSSNRSGSGAASKPGGSSAGGAGGASGGRGGGNGR